MDRLEQLEHEVEALGVAVAQLGKEVKALTETLRLQVHPVEALLWQRGLPVLCRDESSQLLLPPDASRTHQGEFYQLMRRYSFRLFARDLIQFPNGSDLKALSRYCSLRTIRSYLRTLGEMGVVFLSSDGSYRLLRGRATSFGPTLEWYVREIFRREFLAPALFNLRLEHTRFGGDYDVIASLSGHLAYVEVKSSPPRGVELQAVSAFLNRIRDLQPHVAVFLVDTELRMRDKIVPLFTEALDQMGWKSAEWPVVRLANEIFHIRHGIYLINSRKGIYTNLRSCFRDFLRWEREARLPAGDPPPLPSPASAPEEQE